MKKSVIILLSVLLLILPIINAQENPTNEIETEIEKAFSCLESKVGEDCKNINDVEELALTILATPNDVLYESCVNKLSNKIKTDNSLGTIKETALGILALNHAGKDTKELENWLISKEKNPLEIEWFLQVDSNKQTTCNITYDTKDYFSFNMSENKRITPLGTRGDCFSLDRNFWLNIKPGCYNNKTFTVSCYDDFYTNLFYQQIDNPERIFVSDNTISSPAYNRINLLVESRCFAPSQRSSCKFEENVWTTYALLKTGHSIEKYMPYIYAMGETDENQRYLPDAFIYLLNFDAQNYADNLISIQRSEGHWNIPNTPYNNIYDTALALLSLGVSTDEKTKKAKDWLVYTQQNSDGCWRNNVKDTAFVLWAIERREGKTIAGDVIRCEEMGYTCTSSNNCADTGIEGGYYCDRSGAICCSELKRCTEISNGKVCEGDEICSGTTIKSKDTETCCLSECVEEEELNDCEEQGGSCYSSACGPNYISLNFSCESQTKSCCKYSPKEKKEDKDNSWVMFLILGLVIFLVIVLIIIFREKLKALFFKLKNNKKGGGNNNGFNSGGGMPPRGPGNIPPQRYQRSQMPMRRPPLPPQRPMPPQ